MVISVVENHGWFHSSTELPLRLPKIPGSEELHTNPLLYHGISVPQRTYSYPLMVWSEISPLGFCFENQWPLTAQFWWLWSLTGRSGVSLWRLFLPLILLFFLCLLFYYDMEKPLIYFHCHWTSSPCRSQLWCTEILWIEFKESFLPIIYQIFYYSDKNLTNAQHTCVIQYGLWWSCFCKEMKLPLACLLVRWYKAGIPWIMIMIRSICQQNPRSDGTDILLRP